MRPDWLIPLALSLMATFAIVGMMIAWFGGQKHNRD